MSNEIFLRVMERYIRLHSAAVSLAVSCANKKYCCVKSISSFCSQVQSAQIPWWGRRRRPLHGGQLLRQCDEGRGALGQDRTTRRSGGHAKRRGGEERKGTTEETEDEEQEIKKKERTSCVFLLSGEKIECLDFRVIIISPFRREQKQKVFCMFFFSFFLYWRKKNLGTCGAGCKKYCPSVFILISWG